MLRKFEVVFIKKHCRFFNYNYVQISETINASESKKFHLSNSLDTSYCHTELMVHSAGLVLPAMEFGLNFQRCT